ncbi:MAG: GNA1162 family protein [Syntrophorhabdaceae bacterium]
MKKATLYVIALVTMVILLGACVPTTVAKKDAFPLMYSERPLSILVLPAINMTTAADAKEYYLTTVAEPISYAGYYVLPIEVTTDILKSVGLPDTELVGDDHLRKFKEFFGVDAVLFVRIITWNTHYSVLAGNVSVGIECALKSTTTSGTLWNYKGTVVVDTTSSSGTGIGGLITNLIATAIATASADYVPIARRVNYMVLGTMPYGRYHPAFNADREVQIIQGDMHGHK